AFAHANRFAGGKHASRNPGYAYSYPCRARLRLHAQTVPQAGSMLPETPATPCASRLDLAPLATVSKEV
ncbi:MAG TPA: hypothetical protein VM532_15010, partial [Burkholderiales bacterium]|nr:hypothetical protein [Burkholderiales bacterium]